MPRVYEEKPFLCRGCGTTDPERFRSVLRTADGVPRKVKNECRDCNNTYQRARHSTRKEEVKDYVLRQKFGISISDYDGQLQAQEGKCPGCGRTREEDIENRGRRWPVDHDHETNNVRGILCWLCNLALGAVRDEPDTLRRLAEYVEKGGVWCQGNHSSSARSPEVSTPTTIRPL